MSEAQTVESPAPGRTAWWLHPIFFAVQPVLALYAGNAEETEPTAVVRPLLVMLALGIAAWLSAYAAVRERMKASLICSAFFLGFFSWGHVEPAATSAFGYGTGDLIALFVYLAAVAGVILLIGTRRKPLVRTTSLANWIGATLIVLPVAQGIAAGTFADGFRLMSGPERRSAAVVEPSRRRPDIYFILLDGYARADGLKEHMNWDNSAFLDAMRTKGFYVVEQSRTNYWSTKQVMACCLNMDHLDALGAEKGKRSRQTVNRLIHENKVFDVLREKGYEVCVFSSGYEYTEFRHGADVYLRPSRLAWSEFEMVLLHMTPVPTVARAFAGDVAYEQHRNRIRHILREMPEVAKMDPDRPKFVFAHVLAPHQPFVFGPNGEAKDPKAPFSFTNFPKDGSQGDYATGYVGQLRHVNALVEAAMDGVLKNSPVPPVIIVMSDHGPDPRDLFRKERAELTDQQREFRFHNMCMVHLPGFEGALYPTMSPVNVFRVVFNVLFDAKMPKVEDRMNVKEAG